jgi:hypothetical protein
MPGFKTAAESIGIFCVNCETFMGSFFVDAGKLVNGDELMQFLYANQITPKCPKSHEELEQITLRRREGAE